MSTKAIIKKWYEALEFPKEYDGEFYEALESIEIPEGITLNDYRSASTDGKRNLLTFLYFCEGVEKRAEERGIPRDILIDTLKDLVIWTENYTELKGELYLGELSWLKIHMRFEMFRIGRLQFRMTGYRRDIPEAGIKEGDNVLEMHIPRGSKLDIDECKRSMEQAKEFFATYFPEFEYNHFVCWSWLLDDTLKKYLPESSNIIRFGDMFTKTYHMESNGLISAVFPRGTTEENLADARCSSSFAQRIKDALLSGEKFHNTLGFIPKSE
jgi:hypothetical protein